MGSRIVSASLISGGRVLIYGGEDSYKHRKDDFWLLDIQHGRRVWRKLKCEGYQPRSRSFHRACADESGHYLYAFGGMVDGILQPAEPNSIVDTLCGPAVDTLPFVLFVNVVH
ncbi:hypothetical protein R6Q57_017914 [Mikania cordata]